MKNLLIFIICLVLGITATLLILTQTTSKAIVSPKSSALPEIAMSKFSLKDAPSTSLHGDITSLSGEVKWESRIATEAAKIIDKQQVQQGESLETGDNGNVSLAFPDMLFSLLPKTTLNIIQTLPTNLVVEQPTGQVQYQTTSTTPLAIRISPILIQSTTGTFSTAVDEDKGTITVTISSGSATIAYNDSDNVSTVQKIEAPQTLIFDNQTRTSKIK